MGQRDLRPARVVQLAHRLIDNKRIRFTPPWYEAMTRLPPNEALIRPVHRFEDPNKSQQPKRGRRKASRMFLPVEIAYPEDSLRDTFFNDHPWELARPKVVIEDSGNDSKNWDWSRIQQPGKKMDGESVVLRQMWLMGNEPPPEGEPSDPLSIQERAYDKARKEFYDVRQRQDIERQVAKEEAIHYGAYFDVGEIERSLKEEDKQFAAWKEFAKKDVEMAAHQQAGAYRGNNPSEIAEAIAVSSEAEAEQVIEEEADSAVAVPA